jgi:hypothetical protein
MSCVLNKLLHEHLELTPTMLLIILFNFLKYKYVTNMREFPQNINPFSNRDWKFSKYTILRTSICKIKDSVLIV